MVFEVVWTEKSKKGLKLLDKPVADRIISKVEELAEKDIISLEKLEGKDFFKFRIGDYRVLIRKFVATQKLFILKVGHRRNIYKNI